MVFVAAAVFAIWTFASFVLGLCGMGAAMIAIPLMSLLMPTHEAVLVCCAACPFTSLFLAALHWRHCRWRDLVPQVLGILPGVGIGLAAGRYLPDAALQATLATVLVAFLAWQAFSHVCEHGSSPSLAGFSGAVAGFFGTLLSIDGPPVAAYGLYAGWKAREFVATLSVFFLARALATFAAQASAGLYTASVWHLVPVVLGASVVGALAALPLARRVSTERVRAMVRLLVLACALTLAFRLAFGS